MNIGINGFGRMGRLFLRQIIEHTELVVTHINDPNLTIEGAAHLFVFDSIHGRFMENEVSSTETHLIVGRHKILFTSSSQLEKTHWLEVELLIEASGCYRKTKQFTSTFVQGIKKILVACPVKDKGTLNIVYGVNHHLYNPEQDHLVTAASCTTNCLAPIIQVLQQHATIQQGAITTIHDITNTQRLLDSGHNDLRRARAAGESLIPTSSGSTTAIMKIFPELEGKLNGLAIRVPLLNASLIDLVVTLTEPVVVAEVNSWFEQAAKNELQHIMAYETRPLVSVDFKGSQYSTIIDALSTQVINGNMIKILAWYDNEINYVSRMRDITHMLIKR